MLRWAAAGHVSVKQDSTISTRYPTGVVPISLWFKQRRDSFPLAEISSPSVLDSLNQLSARPSAQSSTSQKYIVSGDSTPLESATHSNAAIMRERAIAVDRSGPFRLEME